MRTSLLTGTIVFLSVAKVLGAPVLWSGNGHLYEPVYVGSGGITWSDAKNDALARGGYLATITSADENSFVYDLVVDDQYWNGIAGDSKGPWLGGYQPDGSPEPGGSWAWVTGEPWGYDNWGPLQPDNAQSATNFENVLQFWAPNGLSKAPTWNDYKNDPTLTGEARVFGYVVEFAPEPSSGALAVVACGLLWSWRRGSRFVSGIKLDNLHGMSLRE